MGLEVTGAELSSPGHRGAVGDHEVGVLVSVGSAHPSTQGDPGCAFGAPARPASAPCDRPSVAATGGEGRAAVGVAGIGRFARWVVGGGATAAARGSAVPSAGGLGTATMGAGG
ncbi:MAG: hypothetical protein ACRDSH_18240, partial [Pseudonocardiaceae bacterium]